MQRIKYTVHGRVQGVGFRAYVQRNARQIGVRGYVRNRSDGTVECMAAGTAEQQAQVLACLRQGPPVSMVRNVDQQTTTYEPDDSFDIM
ncbi:MAG: acylphosphatase [Leptospiraceae bacterium]|nr:acylphosphatase [Leptospiraceae bacterium]